MLTEQLLGFPQVLQGLSRLAYRFPHASLSVPYEQDALQEEEWLALEEVQDLVNDFPCLLKLPLVHVPHYGLV